MKRVLIFTLAYLAIFSYRLLANSPTSDNAYSVYLDDGGLYHLESLDVEIDSFILSLRDSLSLDSNHKFNIVDCDTFDNRVVTGIQQTYKGLEVYQKYGAIVSDKSSGKVLWMTFDYLQISGLDTATAYMDSVLVDSACHFIGDSLYIWQDSTMDSLYKAYFQEPTYSLYPVLNKLIFVNPNTLDIEVAVRFDMTSILPVYRRQEIIMSTVSYQDFNLNNHEKFCDPADAKQGTGHTQYNGDNKILDVTDCNGGGENSWILFDQVRNIHTKKANVNQGFGFGKDYNDGNGQWGNGDIHGTSSHWATERSWDYFNNRFGLNGPGNRHELIKIFAEFDTENMTDNFATASTSVLTHPDGYRFGRITIGVGCNGDEWTNGHLNIVGHEYGHLVQFFSPSGVRSADFLLESFSDIFGVLIEQHATGDPIDWALNTGKVELRNMETGIWKRTVSDISCLVQDNQPLIFNGSLWNATTKFHAKAGVQNKWFQLLVDGGVFNGVKVESIGAEKAEIIAFKNMVMNVLTDYHAARTGSIKVAADLYGECSFEVKQVTNAWNAVNVMPSDALQSTPLYSSNFDDYSVDYLVGVNEVINTNLNINSKIVIPSGHTLTVQNCTLKFEERLTGNGDYNIVVEPGGVLKLENATLTALAQNQQGACGNMWGGIIIKGLGFGIDQGTPTGSPHGTVLINNSTLEYAHNAIVVGNSVGNSGGICQVSNSQFLNCRKGLIFYTFENATNPSHNYSRVENSTFLNDEAIPASGGKYVQAHVSLFGVRGVNLIGNEFLNTNALDLSLVPYTRGEGVTTWDASFVIAPKVLPSDYNGTSCVIPTGDPSKFEGLGVGLNIGGTMDPAVKYGNYTLRTDFDNNFIQIGNAGQKGAFIWNNVLTWDIGSLDYFPVDEEMYGIRTREAEEINFVDNTFNANNIQLRYRGSIIRNTSFSATSTEFSFFGNNTFNLNPVIRQNGLYALASDYMGTQFIGNNHQLYMNCNVYNNFITDWRIVHGNLPIQEGEFGGLAGADNVFGTPCTTSGVAGNTKYQVQIDNLAFTLEYRYVNGLPINPNCISGSVLSLPNQSPVPRCQTASYYSESEVYCLADLTDGSGGSSGETEAPALNHSDLEELSGFEKAFYAVIFNNIPMAEAELSSLSTCEATVIDLLIDNAQLGKSIIHIDAGIAEELRAFSTEPQCEEQNYALNLYNHFVELTDENAVIIPSEPSSSTRLSSAKLVKQHKVKVYPNPHKESLTVSWDDEMEVVAICLIDVMGAKHLRLGEVLDSEVTLKTSTLSQGVYFVRLELANGSFLTKKVLKIE